mmetsp:Transcript_21198/g.38696  ORF Transcript_21198/g.38696 Transcript_21198/m.38696 type:complete len:257 (-) Transcript_21198:67-837(-)
MAEHELETLLATTIPFRANHCNRYFIPGLDTTIANIQLERSMFDDGARVTVFRTPTMAEVESLHAAALYTQLVHGVGGVSLVLVAERAQGFPLAVRAADGRSQVELTVRKPCFHISRSLAAELSQADCHFIPDALKTQLAAYVSLIDGVCAVHAQWLPQVTRVQLEQKYGGPRKHSLFGKDLIQAPVYGIHREDSILMAYPLSSRNALFRNCDAAIDRCLKLMPVDDVVDESGVPFDQWEVEECTRMATSPSYEFF